MRRLILLTVLGLGLAACGGSGAPAPKDMVTITFGRSGGTMVPYTITIAPGGKVTTAGKPPAAPKSPTKAEDAELSGLVRNDVPNLKNKNCAGTFPDEAAEFIIVGKKVTVRGSCEPGFTTLWNKLASAVGLPS